MWTLLPPASTFTPAEDAPLPHMVVLGWPRVGQQEYSLQSLSSTSLRGDCFSHSEGSTGWQPDGGDGPGASTHPKGHVLSWDSFHFDDEPRLEHRRRPP